MRVWDVKIHAPDDEGVCQVQVCFAAEEWKPFPAVLPPDVIGNFRTAAPPGEVRGDKEALDNTTILDAAADRAAGQFLGEKLLEALLTDNTRGENYSKQLITDIKGERIEKSRVLLRLDLSDAGPLSDLPWELIYAKDDKVREFLATSEAIGLLRYRKALGHLPPEPASAPLKILLVVADATGRLDTDREVANVTSALAGITDGQVKLIDPPLFKATRREFARRINIDRPHVVHFIGHGSFDGKTGRLHLHADDDPNATDHVDAEGLSTILKNDRPWLIFLNACEGAVDGSKARFGGLAQELLGIGIPFVIAMRRAISDTAARDFATSFYRDFTKMPLSKAVGRARNLLLGSNAASFEFATPALYSSLHADDDEDCDRIAMLVPAAAVPAPIDPPSAPEGRRGMSISKGAIVGTVVGLGIVVSVLAGALFSDRLLDKEAEGVNASAPDFTATDSAIAPIAQPNTSPSLAEPPELGAVRSDRAPRIVARARAPAGGGMWAAQGEEVYAAIEEGAYAAAEEEYYESGGDEEHYVAPPPAPVMASALPPAPPPPSPVLAPVGFPPRFQIAGPTIAAIPPLSTVRRYPPPASVAAGDPVLDDPASDRDDLFIGTPRATDACERFSEKIPPALIPGTRSGDQAAPFSRMVEVWRTCPSWSAFIVGPAPATASADAVELAGRRLATRVAALDLAAAGIPHSQIEEQVEPALDRLDNTADGLLWPRPEPAAAAEWPAPSARDDWQSPALLSQIEAWSQAAAASSWLAAEVRSWNFSAQAIERRDAVLGRIAQAFDERQMGPRLALRSDSQAEAATASRLPLIEVRLLFPDGGAIGWSENADRLEEDARARISELAARLAQADQEMALTGGWRVLIEGHSLRGDTAYAQMRDGLVAASEVQTEFEANGMPADRMATLSCGAERPSLLPAGVDRGVEISILPDGIAAPDLACGWSRPETFTPAEPGVGENATTE